MWFNLVSRLCPCTYVPTYIILIIIMYLTHILLYVSCILIYNNLKTLLSIQFRFKETTCLQNLEVLSFIKVAVFFVLCCLHA